MRRGKSTTLLLSLCLIGCTSGSDMGGRNADVFSYPSQSVSFTNASNGISGNIQGMVTAIMARSDNLEDTCGNTTGCTAIATIEGIASTSSSYNFSVTTNGSVTDGSRATGICFDATATSNSDGSQPWHCSAGTFCSTFAPGTTGWGTQGAQQVFTRSFFIHDGTAGILVLYGLEPPSLTVASNSMQHLLNARTNGLVSAGDRIRLDVTRVRRYGVGTNSIAVITDFTNLQRVSSGNAISYSKQSAVLSAAEESRVVRVEGTVTVSPRYWEISCPMSGTPDYRFQFNHDDGYVGEITDSANNKYCFKLSYNLGAGTLSGFDTGNSFSYNIAVGAKVRMTGPVFYPRNRRAGVGIKTGIDPVTTDPRISTSGLCIALDQKFQVETLK